MVWVEAVEVGVTEYKCMSKKMSNRIKFWIGLSLALAGGVLMFIDVLPLSARITLGIVGIILIATSRTR